jgi:uncharacterized protein YjbJ (UPF0337 family)
MNSLYQCRASWAGTGFPIGASAMKSEQVKGVLEQAAGKAQDIFGDLTGDERLQLEGKARKSAGELQQRYGDLLDEAADFTQRRPGITLAAVAGLTVLVGWLMLRRRS